MTGLTKEAAARLAPALPRVVPPPVLAGLARAQRPVARHAAAAKYRRRYGRRFNSSVHPDDDLLHYSVDFARAEAERDGAREGVPAWRYYEGVRMYFEGGEWNVAEVEKVLRDVGRPLSETRSFLEFACGYGRLTRHFVQRYPPSRMTVSDIDHHAVDFVRGQFGVGGFYSTTTPDELVHAGRYEVIGVVSLFSHLAIADWEPWLRRLCCLLEPGGLLLFSTLGEHAFAVNVAEADKPRFDAKADGFLYLEDNETRGRLSGEHYGTAYVTAGYVGRAVASSVGRPPLAVCPRALNGFQDVYVVQPA